ncbi:ATP-binding cassette domain-containing protein [Pontibacillus litoralis]|uniref:ATP-binding cassette domain-containing protein n=1 Tax=Pontibacillus litoralis TaxID=516703 RepID=UPI0012EC6630
MLPDFSVLCTYHLSGGEQQRLALSRLIIKVCDFILADESTGSLDQTYRNIVLGYFISVKSRWKNNRNRVSCSFCNGMLPKSCKFSISACY